MYFNEFRKIGIDCGNKVTGKAKTVCPKCLERKPTTRDKDLYIVYDTGVYRCYSSKCGWTGSVANMKKEFERPTWKNNTNLSKQLVSYFFNRGISQDTLLKAKVSMDSKNNIEFNYFRNDELINVKTRFEIKGKKAFKQHIGAEKIPYNLDSLKGKTKAIFVEGEIDVLSWVEAGIPDAFGVISVDQGAGLPNSQMDGKLECIRNAAAELDEIKEFYICTDKDAAGVYLQEELIRRLGVHRCFIINLPKGKKDANELLDKSKNPTSHEANKQSLRECLKSAKPVPISGIRTLDDDMWNKMEDQYNNGRAKAKTTHYPILDNHFKFLKGDMTLITGIPSHGKSQFTRQLMVIKSFFDGWKWGCYVPEDFPLDYYYEDLCHIYLGITTDKQYTQRATLEQFHEAMLFVKEHFFCVYPELNTETGETDLPSNKWINERMLFLKLKYGINGVKKDPWNKVIHDFKGSREDLYLAAELSREKFFASQFDAYIIIAHPKQMNKSANGEYPCPDTYDLSGGAMWYNMVDNMLVVHRPNAQSHPDDKMVTVKILKIKKKKLVGKTGEVDMYFRVNAARYYQCKDDFNPLEKGRNNITPPSSLDDIPF